MQAMYYVVIFWPVWLYHVIPLYLINSTIFRRKVKMCVFCFFYNFCLKSFSFLEEFRDILS